MQHETPHDFLNDHAKTHFLFKYHWASIGEQWGAYLVEIPDIDKPD